MILNLPLGKKRGRRSSPTLFDFNKIKTYGLLKDCQECNARSECKNPQYQPPIGLKHFYCADKR